MLSDVCDTLPVVSNHVRSLSGDGGMALGKGKVHTDCGYDRHGDQQDISAN